MQSGNSKVSYRFSQKSKTGELQRITINYEGQLTIGVDIKQDIQNQK